MIHVVFLTLLLTPLFLLAGCGGGGGGGNSAGGSNTGGVVTPPLSVSTPAGPGLSATLAEDNSVVAVGGTETYTLTLTNISSAAITVNASLNGSALAPQASLEILNAAGVVVYPTRQPLHGLVAPPPPPVDNTNTLQPGQSFAQTLPLAVFQSAGSYNAAATFEVAQSPSTTTQVVVAGPVTVTAK